MTMTHSHFQRGRGVFTCAICQRRTRDAGQSEDSGLCYECWELAGYDNHVNDNGPASMAEVQASVDALLRLCIKRGGDEELIRASFDYLFPGAK
jgi:hypothetical protein